MREYVLLPMFHYRPPLPLAFTPFFLFHSLTLSFLLPLLFLFYRSFVHTLLPSFPCRKGVSASRGLDACASEGALFLTILSLLKDRLRKRQTQIHFLILRHLISTRTKATRHFIMTAIITCTLRSCPL